MRSKKSYIARELSNASPEPLGVQILPIDLHIAFRLSPCLSYIRGVLCSLISCWSQQCHDDLKSPGLLWIYLVIAVHSAEPSHHCHSCPGIQTSLLQNVLNSKLSKHHRTFFSVCAGNTWGIWWETFCFVVVLYSSYKYEGKKIGRHKEPTHNA